MSRIDKCVPGVGSFRAPLAAAIATADVGKIQAVSIDSSGRAAIGGAALTDIIGVICPVRAMAAAEQVDVLRFAEIVEATATGGGALTLGGPVFAHISGVVDSTAASGTAIGYMVSTAGSGVPRLVLQAPMATT
jgi:hypothetical protein